MFEFLSSIISGIVSFVSKIGPAVTRVATAIVTKIPVLSQGLVCVAQAVLSVAQLFGIAKPEDKVEEMGAKVMQEETRPKMEEESMEDYMSYLRDEVKLDREKMDKFSDEEMYQCRAIGTAMMSQGIVEKTGIEISPDFLAEMAKMRMTGEELKAYIDKFKENGIDSMDHLTKFVSGDLDDQGMAEMYGIVDSVEKSLDPDMSDDRLLDKLSNWRTMDIEEGELSGGLSLEEKEYIREETGWSDRIIDYISSMDEAKIYMQANLVETMVGDRPALVRQDIDWSAYNCRPEWLKEKLGDWERWKEYNNADLVGEGFPPRDVNGDPYELHHIGQKQDSPYAELTWAEHMGNGNNSILHKVGKESEIDRLSFEGEKSTYWQDRFKMFSDEELKEIYRG